MASFLSGHPVAYESCCLPIRRSSNPILTTHVRIVFRSRPIGMNNGSDFDFIIIGSGAGGGTLAYHLAPSGKKILLIERGPFVPREKENWNSLEVNAHGRYNTKELWRNADGTELHPHTNYYVGGNTKFYGAALFRLREEDFGEIKHFGGTSPAWPISYSELEPYYTEAESIYHVHGAVGEDPTEPQRSGPYPYSAISHEPRIQQLSDDFARLGLSRFTRHLE